MIDASTAPEVRNSGKRGPLSAEEGYELWAASYDTDPNPLLAAEERALAPTLSRVAGRRVLDVACGTGRWLDRVVRAGAEMATGVDLSRGMLNVAQAKTRLPGRLVRGDGLLLPFRDEAADLVICSFALSHVERLELFAREAARVTQHDGEVWMSDLHPDARACGWTTGFRHNGGPAHITTFAHSVREICGCFAAAGLGLLEWRDVWLGERERPLFERAGKSAWYDKVQNVPAVYVARFVRRRAI